MAHQHAMNGAAREPGVRAALHHLGDVVEREGEIGPQLLDRSDTVTHCPLKGDATHYHLAGMGGAVENAACSYESPKPGVEAISGYLAFYPESLAIES